MIIDGEKAIKTIVDYAGISNNTLIARTKKGTVITWRKIACYILYDYCQWTQQQIADRLMYRKHETVKFHVDKMRMWMSDIRYAPKDLHIATRNIMFNLGL